MMSDALVICRLIMRDYLNDLEKSIIRLIEIFTKIFVAFAMVTD